MMGLVMTARLTLAPLLLLDQVAGNAQVNHCEQRTIIVHHAILATISQGRPVRHALDPCAAVAMETNAQHAQQVTTIVAPVMIARHALELCAAVTLETHVLRVQEVNGVVVQLMIARCDSRFTCQ
jgi:hypothetical protein